MQTVLSLKNILSKLFVYLILLPIVGLYSKTWRLNAGQKYCRMLRGSILQYFWPAFREKKSFLRGLLRQVLLYTIEFNGYPIWEIKKKILPTGPYW